MPCQRDPLQLVHNVQRRLSVHDAGVKASGMEYTYAVTRVLQLASQAEDCHVKLTQV